MEVFGNKYLHKKFKKTRETIQQENVASEGCFVPFSRVETIEKDNKITSVETIESVPKQMISSSTNITHNNGLLQVAEPSENMSSKIIISPLNHQTDISDTVKKVSSHNVPTTQENNVNYQNQIENNGSNVYSFLQHPSFANVSSSNIKNDNLRINTTLLTTEYSLINSSNSRRIEEEALIEHQDTKNINNNVIQNEATVLNLNVISSAAGNPTGNGKYICTYCNLACSKPSVLQKHIRAHTNERPYPCVSCGFSFKTRSNLYKHCRSRTHANRVMGNKHVGGQAEHLEQDVCPSAEKEDRTEAEISEDCEEGKIISPPEGDKTEQQHRVKPYKPRFHTAKLFYEENRGGTIDDENDPTDDVTNNKSAKNHPNFLKLRINELINKNNSIVNDDSAIILRRKAENITNNNNDYLLLTPGLCPPNPNLLQVVTEDQPLNLTLSSKNRKRCLSDSDNNCQSQKSLIKELLLKNLSTDPNLQCKYCKMIFQTVTELEMHSMKYCNAKTGNIRYARSSSVNVASILTQNKNAFDNIPHMQNTTFPLKSPGPFLGKTRLIENDRNVSGERRTFSFDDTVIVNNHILDSPPSFNKFMLRSPVAYPLSPQVKKNPIKLFGGEVKITQTSGETRSFKIESSEHANKMICNDSHNFMDFKSGHLNDLSENLVIKSTLGSGGTVLQNKSNYSPKIDHLQSPSVIRVYENNDLSLNLMHNECGGKNKFTFDTGGQAVNMNHLFTPEIETEHLRHKNEVKLEIDMEKELYKSNLIDFGQKAVKLLAPNLKAPNLILPGLPIPNANKLTPLRIEMPPSSESNLNQMDLIKFANKQIHLQQRMAELPQPQHVLNPMNLIVNGKVVRYVPGIPGPVQAEAAPADFPDMQHQLKLYSHPTVEERSAEQKNPLNPPLIVINQPDNKRTPTTTVGVVSESRKSSILSTPVVDKVGPSKDEPKKFVRPTSLALKPNSNSFKNHHGLTPTLFNQALISPDTPRVAKKYCQQYLNGNYFSYLGLKSSTKSVYCTLNKTQPFYVKHFKKLSMYSEWRQQESKIDCLNVSAYDSRQKGQKYTLAGSATADYIVHSSYKFVATENTSHKEENSGKHSVLGGYESNEDYTYIRGRGRGRYVCDQCGIRCKKPSMLKKHIRTHSDDRPYTCEHCNFSFKTKGNLTKHMKSKAHFKKYSATSCTSTQNSVSSSDSEDSETESDESTRLQDHEAAHCLLSLSQKSTTTSELTKTIGTASVSSPITSFKLSEYSNFLKDDDDNDNFLKNSDQITQVVVKNKILDESPNFNGNSNIISVYLGKSSTNRPLTYPYYQLQMENLNESKMELKKQTNEEGAVGTLERMRKSPLAFNIRNSENLNNVEGNLPTNIVFRKRKLSLSTATTTGHFNIIKQHRNSSSSLDDLGSNLITTKAVDLSVTVPTGQNAVILDLSPTNVVNGDVGEGGRFNGGSNLTAQNSVVYNTNHDRTTVEPLFVYQMQQQFRHDSFSESNSSETFSQNSDTTDRVPEKPNLHMEIARLRGEKAENYDTDQSAMQTLAEIAIKQVKLEKNILAKNVATEYLKLALNNDSSNPEENMKKFAVTTKEPNSELMVKPEENKNCTICSKNFSKPSQLRLHMNIHYLERPFRCDSCSVSFRTKGHLQKHERSAGHHNKLSTSPALSSSEPRPFKCQDCNVAFRIHGHLAKHLRSKLHIMKLECLAKIPFGLYAELERANSLLTEINTTDGELCLESLKILARKLFTNDPNKVDQLQNVSETRVVILNITK